MTPLIIALLMGMQANDPAPAIPPPFHKPKLICRESEQETGSHIRGGRHCKTAEEWDRLDQAPRALPPSLRVTAGQGDASTKQQTPR